ncbi:MAG: N-acetyltransferase, partial [Planctomycetaceae bacterium]|nr:N-acetyltransferase [Planctomycetaceae bacterium]
FSRMSIVTTVSNVRAAALAPMAVAPAHQRLGIGSRLVEAGLRACREQGVPIVLVLGHADYYPRFGFSAALAQPIDSPFGGGESWMAAELVDGALIGISGRAEYPHPFQALE